MYEEASRLIAHFSEKLSVNEVVPYLRLPSSRDGYINLWDLKQKRNLVIFFHHGIDCRYCTTKLRELDQTYDNAVELDAILSWLLFIECECP